MAGIDPFNNDELLSLAEVSAMLPTLNGRKIHTATLSRWIHKGVRGVRLDAIRIGNTFATTRDAVQAFIDRLNDGGTSDSCGAPPSPTPPKINTAAHERAMRMLKRAGF